MGGRGQDTRLTYAIGAEMEQAVFSACPSELRLFAIVAIWLGAAVWWGLVGVREDRCCCRGRSVARGWELGGKCRRPHLLMLLILLPLGIVGVEPEKHRLLLLPSIRQAAERVVTSRPGRVVCDIATSKRRGALGNADIAHPIAMHGFRRFCRQFFRRISDY